VAVLAVSASSFSALRCTVSGLFIPESCCPMLAGAPAPEPSNRLPAVEAPGCCQRVTIANAKAPAAASARPELVAPEPAPLLAVLVTLPEPRQRAEAWPNLPLRPPGRSAPAFLLTHAFLI
jgi:hypothetical protein